MSIWNNSTVQNVGGRARGTLNDFEKFILRGNVIDLAVGIVIGAAFTAVVNAFVADIITPFIGIFGKIDLSAYAFTINHSKFQIGTFLNALISFVIIALVIFFFVVKPVNAFMALHKTKSAEAPTTKDCPYCLSSVPLGATRCAFCTSPLQVVEPPQASVHSAD